MAKTAKMTKAQKDTLTKLLAGLKVGEVPAKLAKALESLSEPARQAVLSAMGILAAARADLPDGMLQSMMDACGIESPDDLLDLIAPAEPDADDMEPTVQADSAPTTPEEPMANTDTKNPSPVAKLDDAAKAQIAKAEKDAADAKAQLETLKKQAETDANARVELEKQVATERNARLEKEFIAKAEKLTHLRTPASELGPILKALTEKAPEETAKLEKLLEGWNTQAKSVEQLLKEHGHNRPVDNETTAWGQLQKHAAELRKADAKMTEPQSITKAMELHPKLYDAYLAEQAG